MPRGKDEYTPAERLGLAKEKVRVQDTAHFGPNAGD